ncbi:MAG TPA: lamin tail domain-containing protein [Candidatus Eisenbacteria bacterium]|nr:lamin tail domain-containing protein [Candidatus Eisenbacteria bacterium]
MKKTATTLAALAVVCVMACPAFAANAVRISQIYGGGGNSGATYSNDYIELYNNSGVSIDISGWSLQYGSATGTIDLGTCVNCLTVFPQGSCIGPNGYYLIQLAAGANTLLPALPVTPDLVVPQATANNLSATSGKIALRNSNVTGPCASPVVDLVGYGTANCQEGGGTAGGLSNSSMAVRNGSPPGSQDTDNNNLDFTVVASAVPHNSHTPGLPPPDCNPVPAKNMTWGSAKAIYR